MALHRVFVLLFGDQEWHSTKTTCTTRKKKNYKGKEHSHLKIAKLIELSLSGWAERKKMEIPHINIELASGPTHQVLILRPSRGHERASLIMLLHGSRPPNSNLMLMHEVLRWLDRIFE